MNRRKTDLRLDELTKVTDAFLSFAYVLNRKLTEEERRAHRWIADAWEVRHVQDECRGLPEYRLDAIEIRIAKLRDLIYPDPIRRVKITQNVENVVASRDKRKVKQISIDTVIVTKDGTMSDQEAQSRLILLRRLVASTVHIIKELSLHEGANRGLLMGRDLRVFLCRSRKLAAEIRRSSESLKPKPPRQIVIDQQPIKGDSQDAL